jgi:hypothetical protein
MGIPLLIELYLSTPTISELCAAIPGIQVLCSLDIHVLSILHEICLLESDLDIGVRPRWHTRQSKIVPTHINYFDIKKLP